jgi:putative endopeptidase
MKNILLIPFLFLLTSNLSHADTKTVPPILDETAMDQKSSPCDNFYQYACGGWIENTPIPDDKSSVWRQASSLDEINFSILKKILQQYSEGQNIVPSQNAQKLGDYYQSCMKPDQTRAIQILKSKIQRILQINSSQSLANAVAQMHLDGISAVFNFSIYSSVNDSSQYALYFDQGGFDLPSRDYYFANPDDPNDDKWKKTLKSYKKHIAAVLNLAGYSKARAQSSAEAILKLETQLAANAMTREEQRNPEKLNNPMSLAAFSQLSPQFAWNEYFKALKISHLQQAIVTDVEFYKKLNALIIKDKKNNFSTLKSYLIWHLLNDVSVAMGGSYEKLNFDFFSKELRGKQQLQERERTCAEMVGADMPDALGEAFVKVTDGEKAKNEINMMVDVIKGVFNDELLQLSWLDESTRSAALEKVRLLKRKVGYPDVWKDYKSLNITNKTALENFLSANKVENTEMLSKIGKPVDKTRWDMPVWEVNAYYDPTANEFVFPLAQILPPSLDLNASAGANWGAIGATLGHEMIHGFDDEGHQFDGNGNLNNWWTANVEKEFKAKAKCYVDQANTYEALPGLFVNGEVTLGENLADQGGMLTAYLAYRKASSKNPPAKDWAGFNEEQQFFISYAQSWCIKMRPEALRVQIQSDPHPPADFRVNMVLMNMLPFRKAFNCTEGTKMAPRKTCELW